MKAVFTGVSHPLSIIIPTYNEEPNVGELIERLHAACTQAGITYELIFIDDHSTDGTRRRIKTYSASEPLRLYLKKGKKGKAFSLIEGFAMSQYAYIAMIDADLQYPPEAIPFMLRQLGREDVNIVVANRVTSKTSLLRRVASAVNRTVFGKWLWGIDADVQSGLKVFEKAILNHMVIDPKPWTFDLEFLVLARSNGNKIASYDIEFAARKAGEAKLNVLTSAPQIIFSSLKLKFNNPEFKLADRTPIIETGPNFDD